MLSDSSYSSNQIATVTITLREMACLGHHPLFFSNNVNWPILEASNSSTTDLFNIWLLNGFFSGVLSHSLFLHVVISAWRSSFITSATPPSNLLLSKTFLQAHFFYLFIYLFILATPFSMWDLSSLTRDQTYIPGSGSADSYPLDHQGIPFKPTSSALSTNYLLLWLYFLFIPLKD